MKRIQLRIILGSGYVTISTETSIEYSDVKNKKTSLIVSFRVS